MKYVEHAVYQSIPQGEIVREWLNEMAKDRWELVTVSDKGAYIFRRPLKDQYMDELFDTLKTASEKDGEWESGYAWGLSTAYAMYTR